MFVLDEIRQMWFSESPRVIRDLIRAHPSESFYAGAFWLFYSDDRQILTPALGVNAESHISTHDDTDSTWTIRRKERGLTC